LVRRGVTINFPPLTKGRSGGVLKKEITPLYSPLVRGKEYPPQSPPVSNNKIEAINNSYCIYPKYIFTHMIF
jgi:hypothetical protein